MNNPINPQSEASRDRLPLFDSNCFLGYGGFSQPGAPRNAGELLNTMDYYGISEALVYHSLSHIDSNPEDNYETLLTEVELADRLHPCLPITTSPTANSLEQTRELVNKAIENGVQAVRIYPRRVGPLRSYVWGPMLEALVERSIPVFIDFDLAHWSTLR